MLLWNRVVLKARAREEGGTTRAGAREEGERGGSRSRNSRRRNAAKTGEPASSRRWRLRDGRRRSRARVLWSATTPAPPLAMRGPHTDDARGCCCMVFMMTMVTTHLGREAAVLEEAEQVVVLAVDVAADLDRRLSSVRPGSGQGVVGRRRGGGRSAGPRVRGDQPSRVAVARATGVRSGVRTSTPLCFHLPRKRTKRARAPRSDGGRVGRVCSRARLGSSLPRRGKRVTRTQLPRGTGNRRCASLCACAGDRPRDDAGSQAGMIERGGGGLCVTRVSPRAREGWAAS